VRALHSHVGSMSHEFDVEEFKRRFPKLAEEIFGNKTRQLTLRVEGGLVDPWRNYVPTVIDYIRRCRTVEEAIQVVDYLTRRGELSSEEASELKSILLTRGLEFFGGRKEDDYYYKEAKRYWSLVKRQRAQLTEEREENQREEEEYSEEA
jgi:hypothetical protein